MVEYFRKNPTLYLALLYVCFICWSNGLRPECDSNNNPLFGLSRYHYSRRLYKTPHHTQSNRRIFVFVHALRFKETWVQSEKITQSFKDSFKKVFTSIQWMKKSKIVLLLLCILMFSESLILQFLTLMQQYWKVIDIPIFYFGIIGSGLAFCASLMPTLGKYCFQRFPFQNQFFHLLYQFNHCLFLNCIQYSLFWHFPVILLYCTYQCIVYFNGCYIHDACEESFRATVLSVQSMLSFSKYGMISLLYSFLVAYLSKDLVSDSLDQVFEKSPHCFSWLFCLFNNQCISYLPAFD